jgi:hypothetical protein
VSAARRRRTTTDQRLTLRAAELGFPSLQDYLTARATARRWPSSQIAGELGVHPVTVRDRLDQHRLPRRWATVRPRRAIQRQAACWAGEREARLAGLGFADLEGFSGLGGALLRLVDLRHAEAPGVPPDQIARASSSKATATRRFAGASTASS